MKIAHVATTSIPVQHDEGGAVQRRILGVARSQVELGHEVTVFSPVQREAVKSRGELLDESGIQIRLVPLRLRRPLRDYEYLFQVREYVSSADFDVIHVHGQPEAARVLGPATQATVVLTVDFFRYRLSKYGMGRRYYRRSLLKYHRVLPVSEFCKEGLQDFYRIDAGKLHVIPNGVDLERFYPDSGAAKRVRSKYNLPVDYVLYLGRVNQQKGSDLLPPLAEALSGISVVAAGPIGQFGDTNKKTPETTLKNSAVKYIGVVPDGDLRGLLSGARALVLPTRNDEMFGMVLIEAGACGTPAVASDIGGIPEALGSGGQLFEAGSARAFIASVRSVVQDGAKTRRLGAKALQNAALFSWPEIADRYVRCYEESRVRS